MSMQKLITFSLTFLFAFSVLSPANAARFFKWVDADGNVHYSDKAPDDVESAETIQINTRTPRGNANTASEQLQNERRREESGVSAEDEAEKQRQAKQLDDYCENIRANIRTLQVGGRIQTVDKDGSLQFLEAPEQQEKLNEFKKQETENCN